MTDGMVQQTGGTHAKERVRLGCQQHTETWQGRREELGSTVVLIGGINRRALLSYQKS